MGRELKKKTVFSHALDHQCRSHVEVSCFSTPLYVAASVESDATGEVTAGLVAGANASYRPNGGNIAVDTAGAGVTDGHAAQMVRTAEGVQYIRMRESAGQPMGGIEPPTY